MKLCIAMKDNETTITSDAGMEYKFVYDYSIWSCDPKDPNYVGQEKLYELMGRPLLNSAFEGYNTCLFAYGQVYTCVHVIYASSFYIKINSQILVTGACGINIEITTCIFCVEGSQDY